MANVKKNKKGRKSINKEKEEKLNVKIYERYTCFVVGFIAFLLFFSVLKDAIFIPAFLITIGLELFCIAYYYLEDKNKKEFVYGLFIIGISLVVSAIIYTIIKTV